MFNKVVDSVAVDVCNGMLREARVYKSASVRCGGVLDIHDSDGSSSVIMRKKELFNKHELVSNQ